MSSASMESEASLSIPLMGFQAQDMLGVENKAHFAFNSPDGILHVFKLKVSSDIVTFNSPDGIHIREHLKEFAEEVTFNSPDGIRYDAQKDHYLTYVDFQFP